MISEPLLGLRLTEAFVDHPDAEVVVLQLGRFIWVRLAIDAVHVISYIYSNNTYDTTHSTS